MEEIASIFDEPINNESESHLKCESDLQYNEKGNPCLISKISSPMKNLTNLHNASYPKSKNFINNINDNSKDLLCKESTRCVNCFLINYLKISYYFLISAEFFLNHINSLFY